MRQSKFLFTLTVVGVVFMIGAATQAGEKSDSKVKATASAKKPGADGKLLITIKLEIEQGWSIYANPINASTELLAGKETRVAFQAKDKVMGVARYPKGKQRTDEKVKFDVYESSVAIQADVQRTLGDTSPLEISIHVNALRKGERLLPGVIKLKLP